MPEHLLLVDDNAGDALLLQSMLDDSHPGQYATVNVTTLEEAKAVVWHDTFDAVVLDLSLPDSHGLETIGRFAAAAPNLPIVVLTGVADEVIAREAVRCARKIIWSKVRPTPRRSARQSITPLIASRRRRRSGGRGPSCRR